MSVIDILGGLALVALFAVFVGLLMAAAWTSPPQRRGYEQAKARFSEGKGRDPSLNPFPFGPHRSFRENFRVFTAIGAGFGLMFLVLQLFSDK